MGKKRKEDPRDAEPPEFATENEKKKSRSAALDKLSTETLLIREKECTQDLVKLQNELNHMRTTIDIHYRSDALRAMNTKRYRAEYALGEVKAEIERRARRKMGSAIPTEGIQSGSASGVAAVTPANTTYTKMRETMASCTNVLAETITETKARESASRQIDGPAKWRGTSSSAPPQPQSQFRQFEVPIGTELATRLAHDRLIKRPTDQPDSSASMPASMPAQSSTSQMGGNFNAGSAMQSNASQMGGNFNAGSAMQMMAMMGAMGGGGGMAAGPTPDEMANAAMQFQRMQQAFMGQMSGMSGQGFPSGQAAKPAGAAPPSNVPAGIAKRFMNRG